MSSDYGWVKLHRKLLDNPIFKNADLLQMFIYCLLKASHKDHNQLVGKTVVPLKPGQLVTGRDSISRDTGLTSWKVRNSLEVLEKLEIITIKPTTKYSLISITNWNDHQQDHQQTTNKPPTNHQQTNHKQEVKNGKNGKNGKNDKYTTKHFREALLSAGADSMFVDTWLDIRKKKKATNSEIAFNAFMKQVSLSNLTINQCLQMACENSWSGFKAEWIVKQKDNGKSLAEFAASGDY